MKNSNHIKNLLFLFILCFISFPYFINAQSIKDTINLSSIEVTDTSIQKIPYIKFNVSKEQLQNEDIRDIGDFLRTIPNISGIRKGGVAIDPVIRGFKFSQINVILDNGIIIEGGCPSRMDPVASHVEAEDIEKIEIIKGPFVLKSGPSFGGIINLITEKPHPYEKFEIHAGAIYGFESNWNGQKEHVSVYGGGKKIYFLLSGGYKNYGNYTSGNSDAHDTTIISSFKKYNYIGKLGFSPKKNHEIMLSYNGVHGRDVMYPALPMDENNDNTQIMAIDYNAKEISSLIKTLCVKLYQSNVNHLMDNRFRSNYDSMQMVADVDATTTGGGAKLEMLIKKHKLITGINYVNIYKDGTRVMNMQMQMGNTIFTSIKKTNLWLDGDIQNAGIYAEYNTLFPSYEFNAAIRGDYNSASSNDTLKIIKDDIDYYNNVNSQFVNISASIGLTKKINEFFNISIILGRATRSPNMVERYIKLMSVGYDKFDYLGNPQLKPETNNEVDLTFKFSKDNIGGIYLNGFYSYIQDFISAVRLPPSVIMPQTQGVLGVKQFANTNYVTFKGFEFGYTSPEKLKLGGSMVAAYTYAVITEDTKYLITGTQVTGETTVNNDALTEIPPFETTISVYYKLMKGILIPKVSFRAVADQRHTSVAFYEPYTPGFALLNFSVKYKINKYSSISAGVNNIFDRSYYEHLNRKIIGTTGKLYEPGRIFFINIFVNI